MGFLDKIKKIVGSGKREEVDSQGEMEEMPFDNPEEGIREMSLDDFEDETDNGEISDSDEIEEDPIQDHKSSDSTAVIDDNESFINIGKLIQSGVKRIVLESDVSIGSEISLGADNIIIEGNGHTIDAHGNSRIFNISGNYIIIHNLTFKNGFHGDTGRKSYSTPHGRSEIDSVSEGGAIYVSGKVILIDCIFENNRVGDETVSRYPPSPFVYYKAEGPAIFSRGKCYLYSCDFKGNVAIGKSGADDISGTHDFLDSKSESDLESMFPAGIYRTFQNMVNGVEDALDDEGSGFKSLNEAIRESIELGENYIKLNRDYTADELGEIMLDADNFTLDGDGHTLDGDDKTRIFNVTGSNVTLKNVFIKNGYADKGGAIVNRGQLNIMDSTISKSYATRSGGAIENSCELNMENCKLEDNYAEDYGGAIVNCADMNLVGCMVSRNMTIHWAGAISNSGKMNITGCLIDNNSIDNLMHGGYGGAISNDGELNITDSTLEKNQAVGSLIGGNGGAIINDGELNVTGSTLRKNSSNEGGALYNNSLLTITDSSLSENASGCGAAIKNERGDLKVFDSEISSNKSSNNTIFNQDSMEIRNTKFNANESKNIILNTGDESNLSIFFGTFATNDAGESALCNDGKSCSIEKTTFEANGSLNIINKSELALTAPKIKDRGKTILNEMLITVKSFPDYKKKTFGNGKVEVVGEITCESKFDFGYLDSEIHTKNAREITLKDDVILQRYEKDFYEGGIELDVDGLVIDGNGKTIDGVDKSRIFIVTGNDIVLKNITFKNGHSHRNYSNKRNGCGGAIRINKDVNLTMEDCKFISNTSEKLGAAIANRGNLSMVRTVIEDNRKSTVLYNEGVIDIDDSAISNNEGISLNKGELNICDSTMENNYWAIDNYGLLTMECSTFSRQSRPITNEGEFNVTSSTFAQNKNCAILNVGKLNISNSTFEFNEYSRNKGGAVSNVGEMNVSQSTFSNNKAANGGAIWTSSLDNLKYSDCEFTQNRPNSISDKEYYNY